MDIKDIKKAGVEDANKIKIKKLNIKEKGKEIKLEEIDIKREEDGGKLKSLKKVWKKFWWLLWKDDSFKGWLFSIIVLVIFILFIFFPFLRLVTGTSLPLAIVESCSMYHKGDLVSSFDKWWERHESKYSPHIINNFDFESFIFKNGLNKGDILFIIKAKPEKLKQGDIIIFNVNQQNPVIHRIIKIEQIDDSYVFSTIGDNNPGQLSFEKEINENQLVGKAVLKISPYIGWVKLVFYEHLRPPPERGRCYEK